MKTIGCKHEENIEQVGAGISLGTCKLCHQVNKYNSHYPNEAPKLVKLGRINGAIVLPKVGTKLELPAPEAAELKFAIGKGEPVQVDETAPEDMATKVEAPGSEPLSEKCKMCEYRLSEDGEAWCTSKKCPSRYAFSERPPYRPSKSKGPIEREPEKSPVEVTEQLPEPKSALAPYWNDNREEITRDYETVRLSELYRKWHICSTSWGRLKKAWGIPNKGRGYRQLRLKPSAEVLGRISILPAFPEFNDNWAFPVQEKWLEVYKELRQLEKAS